MTVKAALFAAALTFAALVSAPRQAQAGTYESYHCHCTPAEEGGQCNCYYNFTLGKSQTKEFRGYCDDPLDESVVVDQRDGGTTCTIQSNSFGGYVSKSCTNWDPFSRDTVRIRVGCGTRPPRGGY